MLTAGTADMARRQGPHADHFARGLDACRELVHADVAEVAGGTYGITERCPPAERVVSAVFDAYLARSAMAEGRHSPAH